MFENTQAFSSFAVDDLRKAREFYGETLGIKVTDGPEESLITVHLGGEPTMVYEKPDLEPGNYTILNFPVDDVEQTVDELISRGVSFEHYEGIGQDEKGIYRGEGPTIAWFKDPAGHILSVLNMD